MLSLRRIGWKLRHSRFAVLLLAACILLLCWYLQVPGFEAKRNGRPKAQKILVSKTPASLTRTREANLSLVKCQTSQGDLTIRIRPDWGPLGAEHFMQQVEAGFFTQNVFYRVPPRSHPIAQFGVSPSVRLRHQFEKTIKDDPPTWEKLPIRTGMLAYAGNGKDSRSCHYWFAIEGKSYMGHDLWETPIGHVIEGIDVLQKLRVTNGVDVGGIYSDKTFTKMSFPGDYLRSKSVDWIESCEIVEDSWVSRKHYEAEPVICPQRNSCLYSGPFVAQFLPGCATNCHALPTLESAQAACDELEICGGITKTSSNGFELRSGLGGLIEAPEGHKHETSWVKSGPLVIPKIS